MFDHINLNPLKRFKKTHLLESKHIVICCWFIQYGKNPHWKWIHTYLKVSCIEARLNAREHVMSYKSIPIECTFGAMNSIKSNIALAHGYTCYKAYGIRYRNEVWLRCDLLTDGIENYKFGAPVGTRYSFTWLQ